VASSIGFAAVAIPGFIIPPHVGPGALGALIGSGGGTLIGSAIARSKAVRKVAAADAGVDGDVTVIPLESVTGIEARKSGRRRRAGHHMVVTTADGAAYGFTVKLDKWSADLAMALAARGRPVSPTPQGMMVS
jgi:DNA-binding beta-propeller fold protein YncE